MAIKGNFKVDIKVTENGKNKPEYTLDTDLSGEISLKEFLDFTKKTLVATADQVLAEEQSMGFDKDPLTLINGRKTKDLNAATPFGTIEFISRRDFSQIITEAYKGLLERSKILHGRYIASHYVFLNGTQVATDLNSLVSWLNSGVVFKEKDRVRIVNIQPYGRRLELLGVTAQRSKPRTEDKGRRKKEVTGIKIKIPNGAYQLTTRSLKSRYGKNVSIAFKFIPGSSLGLPGTFKRGRRGKNSVGRPYLYPSIVFNVGQGGLTDV